MLGTHVVITVNVAYRVVRIEPDGLDGHGSGFTIEVDGRPFLITASHVLPATDRVGLHVTTPDEAFDLVLERAWGPRDGEADIAVLPLPDRITQTFPAEPTLGGLTYGQDLYFLGYPLGLQFPMNDRQILPLVKKGVMSAQVNIMDDIRRVYIDGHNNRGFSGGPVVFREGGRLPPEPLRIGAVISAFQVEAEAVYDGSNHTTGHVRTNAGIVVAHSIEYAVSTAEAYLAASSR